MKLPLKFKYIVIESIFIDEAIKRQSNIIDNGEEEKYEVVAVVDEFINDKMIYSKDDYEDFLDIFNNCSESKDIYKSYVVIKAIDKNNVGHEIGFSEFISFIHLLEYGEPDYPDVGAHMDMLNDIIICNHNHKSLIVCSFDS